VLLGRHSREPPPTTADRRVSAVLGRITLWVEHHPQQVAAVSLAMMAFGGLGFVWLRVETDFSKNFRSSSPIVQSLQFVENRLGGAGSWEVNFPAPREMTAEFLDRVRAFADRLRTEFRGADIRPARSSRSLDTGQVENLPVENLPVENLPVENLPHEATTAGRLSKVVVLTDGLDLIPERVLFKTLRLETRLELLSGLQHEFVGSLYNPEAGRMRILLRAFERQPSEAKLKLIADVERLARETFGGKSDVRPLPLPEGGGRDEGVGSLDVQPAAASEDPQAGDSQSAANANLVTHPNHLPMGEETAARNRTSSNAPQSTGLFVLLAFLIESLMSDQWTSFALAAAGITGMVWYEFRSLSMGLMSLIPNVFPNVLVVGLMGWIGLPVNIATAMISCVSMGLTVNSSIIYIDAYQRARARGLPVFDALHETHRGNIGQVVVYSNVALIAGFSVLSLSHFIPLVYFGLLVSLAMLGGLFGNLVFLPLLLGWWDGRKEIAGGTGQETPNRRPEAGTA
ncbi:MAG TPA: hypothetical protein VK137_13905, partial [Planctomycetaceae bacterium]|nr:hypothetical protein [Planctomycetaceae bacterium]